MVNLPRENWVKNLTEQWMSTLDVRGSLSVAIGVDAYPQELLLCEPEIVPDRTDTLGIFNSGNCYHGAHLAFDPLWRVATDYLVLIAFTSSVSLR